MMFSTKAEYGVRVMVELARRGEQADGEPVSLTEIAEHDELPLAYLEHLVARLRKAGLIDSRRGSRGGYLLARPASEITMAEVVQALEGSIAPIECVSQAADGSVVCSRESGQAGGGRARTRSHICPTKLLWTRVQGAIVRTLEDTTLADLTLTLLAAGPNPLPMQATDSALAAKSTSPDSALPPVDGLALEIEPLTAMNPLTTTTGA